MDFSISSGAIISHYRVLSQIGNLGVSPDDGFLRAAYSDEETAAMEHFAQAAAASDMRVRWDAVRNLYIEVDGRAGEFVETGSHLDTVPCGGNFDGAAGVVAGFEALKKLQPLSASMKRGVRLRVWRAEESATFGVVLCGSSAAFGRLEPKELTRRFGGRSLEEAMRSQGADIAVIVDRRPTLSQAEIDGIAAHIELHIEQGNALEVSGRDIGVVTGVRGPRRTRVILSGEFDHSGATPMGLDYRRDVNLALAHILMRLDELANEELKKGADLVQTIGVINSERDFNAHTPAVYQNGATKVSGFGYFTLDIRSIDNDFRDEYCRKADAIIEKTAQRFGVTASIEDLSSMAAIRELDLHVQDVSSRSCEDLGVTWQRMPSGALHDCTVVHRQKRSDGSRIPVGMLFVPCRRGKSHSPDEFTTPEAIAKGASVLAKTLFTLANE